MAGAEKGGSLLGDAAGALQDAAVRTDAEAGPKYMFNGEPQPEQHIGITGKPFRRHP